MMKLAYRVFIVTLTLLSLVFATFAQTDNSKRSAKDDRNTAPTVGTGGPTGGPTGLFTVYDGQTLRRGEFTFSAAVSNYDRDPGNVDITEVPVSFQVGLTNYFELFFNTDAYRGIKVNSPRNLSGFYLPNSRINGISPAAIIMGPRGPAPGPYSGQAIFRPAGSQPFVQYPYFGGSSGTFGLVPPFFSGPLFGFPAGTNAQMGPTLAGGGGNAADNFPGIGSVYGSILPGIVLQTTTIVPPTGGPGTPAPTVFTLAPSYLPDAPLLNRTWGTSAFSTYTVGGKWRMTGVNNPIGFGIMGGYRWYQDSPDDFGGFNQLQRGASPGGSWGDILLGVFADARLAKWANISGNVNYNYNSSIKADLPSGESTLLDRGDELMFALGVDFPVNKWFQPIAELRATRYVGGRTPNAFEQHPIDGLIGARVFPARWWGIGAAYRINFNQQDADIFDDEERFTARTTVLCPGVTTTPQGIGCAPFTAETSFTGVPPGFQPSTDPHGFIFQVWVGRRNARLEDKVNQFANVTAVSVSDETITLPCPAGTIPAEGQTCNDRTIVDVSTTAVDPENDTLTYNYTVSGGRIVGSGKDVQWDLTGVRPGTYTITAAVDDGCGFCGQTQTRTVTVEECPSCKSPCDCPTLTISGPAGTTAPGDSMTFTANVSGGPAVTYNWTISGGGTITSGQGTPSITVGTAREDAGSTITATVTLGGLDPNCNCTTEASDSGNVDSVPPPVLVDEFGKLSNDDVRARLDAFFVELQNNPTNSGYIINYGTDREIAARERLITNHIAFRRFDRSRITLVRGGDLGTGINTKLYRVPPGAENPAP